MEGNALPAHLTLKHLQGARTHTVKAANGGPGSARQRGERQDLSVNECSSSGGGKPQATPDVVQRCVGGEVYFATRDSAAAALGCLSHGSIIAGP